MMPDLGINYEARSFDEEDSQLASALHSGRLSYSSYIALPKYKIDNIMAVIILPNSVCQVGYSWTRYIPFMVQSKLAPKSTDNLMLLSISSLLNQARHTGSLIKSNDIIGALKPQASLPPVGKVAPGSSASEAAPCPSATTGVCTEPQPSDNKSRQFDFNARVATYLDALSDYPAERPPPFKRKSAYNLCKPISRKMRCITL